MALICTRCESSGFLNLHQIVDEIPVDEMEPEQILKWLETHTDNDVQVCDCCGDGEGLWYGTPGEHYNSEDPPGPNGPYAYNGGLCECH